MASLRRHTLVCAVVMVAFVVHAQTTSEECTSEEGTCKKESSTEQASSSRTTDDSGGNSVLARNDMIPIWHDELFAAAENQSYAEFIRVMNEGSTQSRLVSPDQRIRVLYEAQC